MIRETGDHKSTVSSVDVTKKPGDDISLETDSIPKTLETLAGKSKTSVEETVESETSSTESDPVRMASLDESFPDPQDTDYTLTESVIFREDCIDNSISLKQRQGIEICLLKTFHDKQTTGVQNQHKTAEIGQPLHDLLCPIKIKDIASICALEDMYSLQHQDEDLRQITDFLEMQKLPEETKVTRLIAVTSDQNCLDSGILYHYYQRTPKHPKANMPSVKQLCVHRNL